MKSKYKMDQLVQYRDGDVSTGHGVITGFILRKTGVLYEVTRNKEYSANGNTTPDVVVAVRETDIVAAYHPVVTRKPRKRKLTAVTPAVGTAMENPA